MRRELGGSRHRLGTAFVDQLQLPPLATGAAMRPQSDGGVALPMRFPVTERTPRAASHVIFFRCGCHQGPENGIRRATLMQ